MKQNVAVEKSPKCEWDLYVRDAKERAPNYHREYSPDGSYSLFQFEGSDVISVLKSSVEYSSVFFKCLFCALSPWFSHFETHFTNSGRPIRGSVQNLLGFPGSEIIWCDSWNCTFGGLEKTKNSGIWWKCLQEVSDYNVSLYFFLVFISLVLLVQW